MATRPSTDPMARPIPSGKNLQIRDWNLRDDSRLRTIEAVISFSLSMVALGGMVMSMMMSRLPAVDMAIRWGLDGSTSMLNALSGNFTLQIGSLLVLVGVIAAVSQRQNVEFHPAEAMR